MADGKLIFDTKLDSSGLASGLKSIGSVTQKAFGVSAKAITAVSGALSALGGVAVKSFAEYEQLAGGIETLFGAGGAKSVEEYAARVGKSVEEVLGEFQMLSKEQEVAMMHASEAYKTAGLSANEYMQTVTGFAAALKQSSESNFEAIQAADQALIDMADNANKMGTDMQDIQNAYQGFAKQNYTMLDNLKLGYGGTKEEMERLLADAEKLSGVKYDISSLNDVYAAIHVVQTELGITGTTALEASTTIEGSLKMAKAAWSNLMVGVADDTQDFDTLVNNFVESTAIAADNLLPRIETTIRGMGSLIEKLLPVIVGRIPVIISDVLPDLVNAATGLVSAFCEGMKSSQGIDEAASDLVDSLVTALVNCIDDLVVTAIVLCGKIAVGIAEGAPQIVQAMVDCILNLAECLMEWMPDFVNAGVSIILALVDGFSGMIPDLFSIAVLAVTYFLEGLARMLPAIANSAVLLIQSLIDALIAGIPQLLDGAVQLFTAILEALPVVIDSLLSALPELITSIITFLVDAVPQITDAAVTLLMAVVDAIPQVVTAITQNLPGIIDALVTGLTDAAPQILDAAVDLLMALVDAIPQVVTSVTRNLPQIITAIITSLGKAAPKLFACALGLLGKLVEAIPEIAVRLIEALPQIIEALVTGLLGGIPALLEAARELGGQLLEGIQGILTEAWDGILTFFSEQIPAFIESLSGWLAGIGESIGTWFSGLGEQIYTAVSGLIDTAVTFIAELPGKIAYWLGYILTSVALWGIDLINWAVENIPIFVENIVNFIAELPGRIAEWLGNVIAAVIQWGADMIARAVQTGSQFVQNVISFISGLPGKVQTWLTNTIARVLAFAANLKSRATEAGNGFITNIVNALTSLPGKMAEIGSNVVSGIWNGISSGWSWLVDQVKGLANSLLQGAKDALGIHSPSKKFRWIGEMCVEGMDEPLEDYNPYGTLKASMLAGEKAFRNDFKAGFVAGSPAAVSTTSKVTNQQTVNIYQPVKTPSETARAIRLEQQYGLAGD